jgi:hypothetical protein
MVSGILRFLGCSGIHGLTNPSFASHGNLEIAEIFSVVENAGNTTGPTRLGFFGSAGAPNSSVQVNAYQNRTHRVDHNGNNLGTYINVKFTGTSDAEVSGVPFPNIEDIPSRSGTIMVRFLEPTATAVSTQNGIVRAITITDASGALTGVSDRPSNVVLYGSELQNTHGGAGDSSWTLLADTAGAPTDLTLNDQAGAATVHDWYLCLSGSPKTAGRKRNHGFLVQIEYLAMILSASLIFI